MDSQFFDELWARYAPSHQLEREFVEPLWVNARATAENIAEYVGYFGDDGQEPTAAWLDRQALRIVMKALDVLLHADVIEFSCECGQFPIEEYGPRCPSCPTP